MMADRIGRCGGGARAVLALALGLGFLGACTGPADPGDGDGDGDGGPACTTDADCPANQHCTAGECVPDDTSTNGAPEPDCLSDADCAANEHCTAAGDCEPDDDTPPGSRECEAHADCATGENCSPEGLCVPDEGEQPCAADIDCLAGEVCSPAGYCADADDPNPPGSGGAGSGDGDSGGDMDSNGDGGGDMDSNGGGDVDTNGDGEPACAEDADCAVGEVCSDGACEPAPPDQNMAAVMAGCWRLTFSAPGAASQVGIYQFDESGALERTWIVNVSSGAAIEEVRYTVANAPFWNGLLALAEQEVYVDPTQTSLRLSTGLIFYDFVRSGTRCLIRRTTVCTDLTQIDATLSSSGMNGPAPDTITAGTLAGSQSCESTTNPDNNFETPLSSTVTGEKLPACPDPADPLVSSQEEQGDLCF